MSLFPSTTPKSPSPIEIEPLPVFRMKPPFTDLGNGADLILRSCDDQYFFVHHVILSLVSPVFREMFIAVPPRPQGPPEPLQTVHLTEETSFVLDRLLRICYPVSNPDLEKLSLEDVDDCLRVSHKYEMVHCTNVIAENLIISSSWWGTPLLANATFAIACRWNLRNLARVVAKEIALNLRTPFGVKDGPEPTEPYNFLADVHPGQLAAELYVDSMHDIPASSLYRLISYAYSESRDPYSSEHRHMNFCHHEQNLSRTERYHAFPFNTLGPVTSPDIVIKSCDGIEFNVQREILAKTSSILPDGLSSESAIVTGDSSDSLYTVDVAIDSTLLSPLLQLCYELESESFNSDSALVTGLSHNQAEAVFLLALRNRVIGAKDFMAAWLRSDIYSNPLRVYLMSARLGFNDVAQDAAIVATQRNIAYSYDSELENTQAGHYFALLQYSHQYQETFMAVVGNEKLVEAATKNWEAVCEVLAPGSGGDHIIGGPDAALAFVLGGMKKAPKARAQKAPQSTTRKVATATRRSKRLSSASASAQVPAKNRASIALAKLKLLPAQRD
ncbi:hypothetical protein EUX98_g3419 [Antrodiella citrinella]|uniref:BTB domain-containing protein n=1 Tax=Antrodiella citrinella TaxID=2447956 RepID=A0A4S4N4R2_9APHY|nr:hypothetical protein EUX98_g3419 [Antrodiella citrinella]